MIIEWWHWVVGGLALIVLELFIPSFFVIWFGLGALPVALLLLAVPGLPLATQVLVWFLASVTMTVLWFQIFNKRFADKTRSGTATGDAIGEIGLLVHAVAPFTRGKVRFQRPILGTEEWQCTAETDIPAGERVKILAIEGNFVKVEHV
ncbi:MAG: NfeD family protein [Azoarcus sp.]|jgi:membrane protein implicated in regulation of membrane protease activity|nr:NfeD family protein [Azoarcus sp.]